MQDDGYIPNTVEKQIFETLAKIRQRDSSIYDSKKHFFKEPADSNSHGGTASASLIKKASKPMRLKDVIAQQARRCVGCYQTSHCAQYGCYAIERTKVLLFDFAPQVFSDKTQLHGAAFGKVDFLIPAQLWV